MTQNELQSKIDEYIKEIPCLSVSAVKTMEICNNAAASPLDINNLVSLDPVLTGRVFQLLTNAYEGEGGYGPISLVRFVTMLGINTVKNLALATAALAALPENIVLDGMDIEDFWRHSLCVGIVSRLLAAKQGVVHAQLEEYFVAGLLHDIGKIPLNAVLSKKYLPGLLAGCDKIPLYMLENETLQTNHCITGGLIARSWNLRSPITDVIMHHHDLANTDSNILNIVVVANYFSYVTETGFAGDRYYEKPDYKIWKACGFTEKIFDEIKETVTHEIEKAQAFLKIL